MKSNNVLIRERISRYGVNVVSNAELIATVLNLKLELANNLLEKSESLDRFMDFNLEEMQEIIGTINAIKLLAVLELSKRFRSYRSGNKYRIQAPKDCADLVMAEMKYLKQEVLKVVLLDTKNYVIGNKDISIGSLNSSIVHPRDILNYAIRKNAASIIVVHNHPSGDPTPSNEDTSITERLKECGKLIGIEMVDHIIIGDGTYISLKEKGII